MKVKNVKLVQLVSKPMSSIYLIAVKEILINLCGFAYWRRMTSFDLFDTFFDLDNYKIKFSVLQPVKYKYNSKHGVVG